MKAFKQLFLIALFFYLPLQSMAWGIIGHRVVGLIAESYLSNKARKEINKILGTESVAMASNWADFIKSDPTYNYLDAWHYINIEAGLTEAQFTNHLEQDTSVNAYSAINFLVKELKNKNLELERKQMYLRLLIHMVGDIHQPMHVSREEDLGGNRIRVQWFGEPSNLHRVWDEQLITYQKLSYTEYAAAINFTTTTSRKVLQQQPLSTWLFESYQISDSLYKDIKQPDERLSYTYNFKHIETLNNQLLKGGVRLAGLLNEIYGGGLF